MIPPRVPATWEKGDPQPGHEPLLVDEARFNAVDLDHGTGFFVRAKLRDVWGTYDIVHLERASLIRWLRSRGGKNAWAESVVLALLGHEHTAGLD